MNRYHEALKEVYRNHFELDALSLDKIDELLKNQDEIEIWWCSDGRFLEILRLENEFVDIQSGTRYTKEEFRSMVTNTTASLVTRKLDEYAGDASVWFDA